MNSRMFLTIFLVLLGANNLFSQTLFPLYKDKIPNSTAYKMVEKTYNWNTVFAGYKSISVPTLEVFMPSVETANGSAVIICPGGGYGRVTYQNEGLRTAKEFVKHGVTAFVLKYRLPSDSIMIDKTIGPLQDAQQAIKLIRQRASEWHIDVNKVGIMGFSAGGHLASTTATHFDKNYIENTEQINLRPDFVLLVYPVVSMTDALTHQGSRENLLGTKPSAENIKLFSNELQVTVKTPPTYLTHTADDKVVSVQNSIQFYQALLDKNVPVEMHLYPTGDHGFVMKLPNEVWMQPLFLWMKNNNWIN